MTFPRPYHSDARIADEPPQILLHGGSDIARGVGLEEKSPVASVKSPIYDRSNV